MADFLQGIVAQRRLAQQRAYQQQQLQARMMQMRALEAQRQRQHQQQQAVQQRLLQQQGFANQLGLRGLQAREGDIRSREADRRRRQEQLELAARRGTLKQGYRWRQDNPLEQEIIPHGPEWTKLRAQHSGDVSKLQSVNNSTQELVRTIDYILDPKNKSGFEANFGGWNAYLTRLLPNIIPGFARTGDVSSAIERLTELAETSGLGGVRGGSGQSVGAITEREWPKFAAQLLKTSPRLEEDTARMFLKEARANALNLRNRELGAYENEWKPTPFYSKDPFRVPVGPELGRQPGGPPAPQGVDPADWAAMDPKDRELWNPQSSQ